MNTLKDFASKVGTAKRTATVHAHDRLEASPPIQGSQGSDNRFTGGNLDGIRRWSASDTIFWAAKQTYDKLPPGLYRCGQAPGIGSYLDKQDVHTDDLLILPDPVSKSILSEFETFWGLKSEFSLRGFLFKRGFLLWGPPGSGKTCLIQLMIKTIIERFEGIVIYVDAPTVTAECLQMVRKVEPDRPMICILEDLDALVERYGENEYLSLLDGESQVNNVIFLASTNYPERLDKRFVDRPSRFDTVQWVGMPNSEARRIYFKTKEPSLSSEELDFWVNISQGFSIAHLREMIISVKCYKKSVNEVVQRLEDMHARHPNSEDAPDKKPIGFGIDVREPRRNSGDTSLEPKRNSLANYGQPS